MLELIGTALGQYHILEEVGRGNMGAVYKGYDTALEREVAIKVLAPHLVWEKGFVERFLREARAAAKLDHPNIVTIHNVGQQGDLYYFVMKYLEGQTLAEIILQQGALPLSRVARIAEQVASALDYAHAQRLVHRDVKPGNIIIGPGDQATLTDFGIVKAAEGTSLTGTGTLIGTPQYMAPEQVRGQEIGSQTDIYALGIVCYEMLTGCPPFGGDTPAILYAIVHESPPRLRSLNPQLPAALESVIGKALAKEPKKRYGSATELVAALKEKAVFRPPKKSFIEETISKILSLRVHPAIIRGAMAAILVVVGVIFFSSYFPPEPASFTVSVLERNVWRIYTSDKASLVGREAQAIIPDAQGHIWVGTTGGIGVFDGHSWDVYTMENSGLESGNVRALAIDGQGRVWVGTPSGVMVSDGHSWGLYCAANSGLTSDDIRTLAIDGRGRVWAGTPRGLMVFDSHSWGVYTTDNSDLTADDIRALAIDGRGRVWAGTPSGLMVFDGHSWGVYTTGNSDLMSDDIRALAIDGRGRVWAGTPSGVMVFDGHSWGVYTLGNSDLASDDIQALAVDAHNRVWVGH